MSAQQRFRAHANGKTHDLCIDVHTVIIAGWTGRDAQAVEHHIRELEAIGVRRPASVPMFYRVAAANLTGSPSLQVAGRHSTGEVEFVLVADVDGLWVGLGSDHTDRDLEKHSVSLSKQVCGKPIATSLWRFDEVADHWDELELRSHAIIRGERRLYQRGGVKALRRPADLIDAYCASTQIRERRLRPGTIMFCGTLPVDGDLEFADRFEIELRDPRLDRSLTHAYDIEALPLAD
jgi:hypothetical protein